MNELKPQMVVRNKKTGQVGVLCPTIYLLTMDGDDELSICYGDGGGATLNIEGGRDNFEIIGTENAIPTPEGCGFGLGEKCCIFATGSAKGFECERHGSMRYDLIFKSGMSAKREPKELYPKCLLTYKEKGVE